MDTEILFKIIEKVRLGYANSKYLDPSAIRWATQGIDAVRREIEKEIRKKIIR
jgi:hypothetical protein